MHILKISKRAAVLAGLCTAIIGLCFNGINTTTDHRETLKLGLDHLSRTTLDLQQQAENFKFDRISEERLRTSLDSARHTYKKVEFMLEYYYPGFVEEHINGAPLLHIERFSTLPFVVPPEGLQVLDELIYSDDPKSEKLQIAILAQKLATQSSALINGFRQRKTEPHEVIEACRMELVRILTLGLTGFDTPGSVNAISEAEYCLRFMRKVVHQLLNEMDTRDPGTADELFRQAVQYLQDAEGFDELDRLYFLRSHLQPLYARLYDIQLQLGGNEKTSRVTAWNPASRSFFSGEFLNPYFYTELRKEEDGPALHQLGEKLFYDTRISRNAKLSCASCHNPQMAFTDGQAKSESSVAGMTVQRNSPTLLNAVYADRYFYDLRAFSLEQQAEHVIFNHAEFNTAYDEIAGKLSVDKEYRKLFKKAFPKTGVNRSGLSRALASYVLSLQSFNSDFDKYARGESEVLPAAAQRGFNLFMGKAGCGTCHFAPTFSGLVPPFYTKNESEILGITESADEHEADSDMGRYANSIYSEHAWIYERSFKTSTVRNVAVTAPYFHNGAFQSLEEVVNFYDHGGGQGLGLEIKNQTLPPDSLMLSNDEKTALIAFMQTLTDTSSYKQY